MTQVLLVDDDAAVRDALAQTLMLAGYDPVPCGSFVVAKDHITQQFDGVILSDIRMPGRDGFHLLAYAQEVDPDLPVILLTGEGDIPMAVRAMGQGAFGFLEKPCEPAALRAEIDRAAKTRALVQENRALKSHLERGDPAARMIFGKSEKVEILRDQVRRVAATQSDALILAAPGSGIPKVAEVVHLSSQSARASFEKRAADGLTVDDLRGSLSTAQGGTLFLDEIALLPAQTQFALLEQMENNAAPRVIGGASDQSLLSARLNPDLYYRLDVGRICIPALSERPEDIPVLFRHYVAQAAEQAGIAAPVVTEAHCASLLAQDWPGNARSLMSAAMRFVLGMGESVSDNPDMGLAEQMAGIERALLVAALGRQNGRASAAAQALKLPRKTFYDKLARYGIKPEDYKRGG